MSETTSARPKRKEMLLLAAVLAVVTFALFMHLGVWATNVTPAQWTKAARHVKSSLKKGDRIAVVPYWALRGAEALRGLPLSFAENPAAEDLSGSKRLWVVLAPRLGRWWFIRSYGEIIDALAKKHGKPTRRVVGPVHIYLFKLKHKNRVLVDFAAKESYRRAEVWLQGVKNTPRSSRCSGYLLRRRDYFRRWQEKPGRLIGYGNQYFGRIIQETGDTPRDCLHVKPLRCRALHVRYPAVKPGRRIAFEHGFATPTPGLKPGGPPLKATVLVGGKKLGSFVLRKEGVWSKRSLPIPPSAKGKKDVEFVFVVPGAASERKGYCFRARMLAR